MRQVMSRGVFAAAAATGILAITGGSAQADAGAGGATSNSPGVLSGNGAQVPVHVPANVCGNTANVIALLNPAFGNECSNSSDSGSDYGHGNGSGSGADSHGASAESAASNSPGVASGNNAQVPIDVPVNACGNSVDVIGALNPTFGNECGNDSSAPGEETPVEEPPTSEPPVDEPATEDPPAEEPASEDPVAEEPASEEPWIEEPAIEEPTDVRADGAAHAPAGGREELARTGADSTGLVAAMSTALLAGGILMVRRSRATQG